MHRDPTSTERAGETLRLTAGFFPRTVDPSAVSINELALAGLGRCRRLLEGMLCLHDAHDDLVGILARTLYETWLNSLYLVLGHDKAHSRLEANDQHLQRRMAAHLKELGLAAANDQACRKLDRQVGEILAEPKPARGELSLVDIAKEVQRLLKEEGDPAADFPLNAYAMLYRVESYVGTHGGLGALKQTLLEVGSVGNVIRERPLPQTIHEHRLALCAAMVATLGWRVAKEVGLDSHDLEVYVRAWIGNTAP